MRRIVRRMKGAIGPIGPISPIGLIRPIGHIGLISLIALMALMGCSEVTPEEKALAEAKEGAQKSYQALLDGRYEDFLEGRARMDSIPNAYREQLITSYKQYILQQRKVHGDINSIQVSNARIDSTQHLIQVFLILNYADSLQEEIVVPMIEHNGEWKMK